MYVNVHKIPPIPNNRKTYDDNNNSIWSGQISGQRMKGRVMLCIYL